MAKRTEADWDKIRAEWQTTDVSDATLAKRWGFKSPNSIRRERIARGWTKDVDAIAAGMVTQAVAYSPEDKALQNLKTRAHIARPNVGEDVGGQHNAHTDEESNETVRKSQGRPLGTVRGIQRDADDREAVITAKSIATIHAAAIRQQIGVGEMAITTGTIIANELMNLASDDPDLVQRARAVILSINPEKETYQGMIKAVTGLLEVGVKIKRLALGMDIIKNPEGVTPSQVAGGRAASKVIERLDMETLMKLRGAAQEIARLPPPTIEGESNVEEG